MENNKKTARGGGEPQAEKARIEKNPYIIISFLGVIATLIIAYTAATVWDGIECALVGLMTFIASFSSSAGGNHERNKTIKAGAVHDCTRSNY